MKDLQNDNRFSYQDKQVIHQYGLLYQNVMLLFTIGSTLSLGFSVVGIHTIK